MLNIVDLSFDDNIDDDNDDDYNVLLLNPIRQTE